MASRRRQARRLEYTAHALDVMRRRNVERHEVAEVVNRPEFTYPSGAQHVFQKGQLAVVLHRESRTVVTVLKRADGSLARWTDEEVANR